MIVPFLTLEITLFRMVKGFRVTDSGRKLVMSGARLEECIVPNSAEGITSYYTRVYGGNKLFRGLAGLPQVLLDSLDQYWNTAEENTPPSAGDSREKEVSTPTATRAQRPAAPESRSTQIRVVNPKVSSPEPPVNEIRSKKESSQEETNDTKTSGFQGAVAKVASTLKSVKAFASPKHGNKDETAVTGNDEAKNVSVPSEAKA